MRLFGSRNSPDTFYLDERDEAGAQILSEMRYRGISRVAVALAQSADHVMSFFKTLRTEMAFYVGCINLHERLTAQGEPVCFPTPRSPVAPDHHFEGLYDVCLSLQVGRRVVGNAADLTGKSLVLITGANQGGKSTFLRSLGTAQLMMQCGMFVGAETFEAPFCPALFTHYKREEELSMKFGKLDEELARMSAIVDHLVPHSVVLLNESSAGTIKGNYPILPGDTDLNRFTDTLLGFYVDNKIQWTEKFRWDLAFRGDKAMYNVTSLTPPYVATELPGSPAVNFAKLNSGTATKFLPSPKGTLIFGPWAKTELYVQAGYSFHSNDARGATQRVEPISPDYPFPTPSSPIPALVETRGGEFGVRTAVVPHLQSTLSLWYLRSNSELQQDGDTGATVASLSPSNRYGIEWANYYTPTEHLVFDLDMADSRAQFFQLDPDDAAYTNVPGAPFPVQGPGGKLVPEAVRVVISSGITLHDYKGFTSTLRLRYFGPRDLTSDGINRSAATLLLNMGLGYRFNQQWRIAADFLNLTNRRNDDITYAYVSRITPTASPAFTNVFHPAEPSQLRFSLVRTFGGF